MLRSFFPVHPFALVLKRGSCRTPKNWSKASKKTSVQFFTIQRNFWKKLCHNSCTSLFLCTHTHTFSLYHSLSLSILSYSLFSCPSLSPMCLVTNLSYFRSNRNCYWDENWYSSFTELPIKASLSKFKKCKYQWSMHRSILGIITNIHCFNSVVTNAL